MKRENKTLRNKCEFYKKNFLSEEESGISISNSNPNENKSFQNNNYVNPKNNFNDQNRVIIMDESNPKNEDSSEPGITRINVESKKSLYMFTVFTIITMLVLLSEGPSGQNNSGFSENSYKTKTIDGRVESSRFIYHSWFMIFKVGLCFLYLCSFLFYFKKNF